MVEAVEVVVLKHLLQAPAVPASAMDQRNAITAENHNFLKDVRPAGTVTFLLHTGKSKFC